MRAPSTAPLPPLVPALALCVVPAGLITLAMAVVVALANNPGLPLAPTELRALYNVALLLNVAVWFGFAPAYLHGWVQYWDPGARVRTGGVGLVALTSVAWMVNLGAYGVAGNLIAAVLR
jgi:hypothetical protein